jgi:hypothetical protein
MIKFLTALDRRFPSNHSPLKLDALEFAEDYNVSKVFLVLLADKINGEKIAVGHHRVQFETVEGRLYMTVS